MSLSFDLISDLHVESWAEPFDWTHRATSAWCVVAGDVARDRDNLCTTLENLGRCYQAVFYIDGNDEHHGRYADLGRSYMGIKEMVARIPGVVYLQDNVVILNDVAILGTNGWWGFDFDDDAETSQVRDWWCTTFNQGAHIPMFIDTINQADAVYINRSLVRLQSEDVKHVVVVTHTVPQRQLIAHDPSLVGQPMFNIMGNRHMSAALAGDINRKVHTWCFGHYHGKVDQIHDGIRYVNNCRGRSNTPWRQMVYNPLKIDVRD
jgi:predicted phosphodiesterase